MTKIIDEDVQYKEDVKCHSSVVVATLRAEAKATLAGGSATAVTIGTDDVGKVLVCLDAVVTLPEAVTGRIVELCCLSTTGALVLTNASTDLFYDSAGYSATAVVVAPFCVQSFFAPDGASWVLQGGYMPSLNQA